jgi:hypothetical protein
MQCDNRVLHYHIAFHYGRPKRSDYHIGFTMGYSDVQRYRERKAAHKSRCIAAMIGTDGACPGCGAVYGTVNTHAWIVHDGKSRSVVQGTVTCRRCANALRRGDDEVAHRVAAHTLARQQSLRDALARVAPSGKVDLVLTREQMVETYWAVYVAVQEGDMRDALLALFWLPECAEVPDYVKDGTLMHRIKAHCEAKGRDEVPVVNEVGDVRHLRGARAAEAVRQAGDVEEACVERVVSGYEEPTSVPAQSTDSEDDVPVYFHDDDDDEEWAEREEARRLAKQKTLDERRLL